MSKIWCKLFNTAISHCFSFFKDWTTKKGGKPKHHENVSPDGPIKEISSEEDEDTVFCDGTKYASAVEAKKQIMVQMQNQLGDNLKNILFTDMMPSLQKIFKNKSSLVRGEETESCCCHEAAALAVWLIRMSVFYHFRHC